MCLDNRYQKLLDQSDELDKILDEIPYVELSAESDGIIAQANDQLSKLINTLRSLNH